MKCSNCGQEIQEGHLYCEYCGEEICFVPDLDIEVEDSIHETLSTLVESMTKEQEEAEEQELERYKKRQEKKLRFGVGFLLALLVVLGMGLHVGIALYHGNSFSYQSKKADEYAKKGNYEQAVQCLERASTLQPESMETRMLWAEYAVKNGDMKMAKQVLRDALAREDENVEAYKRLIDLYVSEQDYEAINRLLLNSDSKEIREKFRKYLALEPEFSNAEGSYTEVVALKLSAHTTGNIYYTLDGSVPTEHSKHYTTPILLESGDYDVSAVFINEYGISSQVVKKHYTIDVAIPLAPQVNCISGSYNRPVMIVVTVPEECKVYYTLDGATPTLDSIPYSVPIAMPLGKSTFRFVAYSPEGIAGEITTRNYTLKVATNFTPEEAVTFLLQELKARGVITEFDGSVPGKNGKNVYIASTLIQIGQNDFYLIAEYYQDAIGMLTLTGNLYGVEANAGTIYRVTTDEKGNYLANPY